MTRKKRQQPNNDGPFSFCRFRDIWCGDSISRSGNPLWPIISAARFGCSFFFVVGFELGAAAPLETEAAPNTENKKGRRSPEDLAPEVIETLVAGATQTYPLKDLSNT